jgi:hypothetical protein
MNATAMEYFVSVSGDDKQDGKTWAQSLRTISNGIPRLKPGDTLTIGPGIYQESIRCTLAGTSNAPITIRAARPRSVCLDGFVSTPRFTRVAGMNYTYSTPATVPDEESIVMERKTGKRLRRCPNPTAVEQVLGSCCVDLEKGLLYVHATDSSDPNNMNICISVVADGMYFEARGSGTNVIGARNLIIDGLEIRGYSGVNRRFGGHGLGFEDAEDVVVRNCEIHDCGYGIWFRHKSYRLKLLNNAVYRCWYSYMESGNIQMNGDTHNSVVAGNRVFDTEYYGLRTYSAGGPGTIFESNIVWNCQAENIGGFKGGTPGIVRYNISSGYSGHIGDKPGDEYHNTVFGESGKEKNTLRDGTDLFYGDFKDPRCLPDAKLVDPVNWDFRLQSDSPARGKAPDGTDLGACPYRGDVFFVSPGGDDKAEGTSVASAWKTLARACAAAKPGQTILLCAGTYAETLVPGVSGKKDKPLVFRRRGNDEVRLTGKGENSYGADLRERSFIRLEGLDISGYKTAGISAGGAGSAGIEIVRCVVRDNIGAGIILGEGKIEVKQCTLAGNKQYGLQLTGKTGDVAVTSCILAMNQAGQISVKSPSLSFYSDYNDLWGTSTPLAQWHGKAVDNFSAWQAASGQDQFSRSSDPLFADQAKGDYRLKNESPCEAGGMAWCDQGGAVREVLPPVHKIARLTVGGITPTTATISWWTEKEEGNTRLEWGPTPQLGQEIFRRFEHVNFHHVTLTGLKPDTTYYFRAHSQSPGWLMHDNPVLWAKEEEMKRAEAQSAVGEFRTVSKEPAARTLYVSRQGQDENDGLSAAKSFRHINRAANQALPGDTVVIEPGQYEELVMPLNSGLPERPITFKSSGWAPVIIDGHSLQPMMVAILGKSHIIIEGFHFKGQLYHQYRGYCDGAAFSGQVWLDHAGEIIIRRCFFDGRGNYVQHALSSARDSNSSVVIEDCAFLGLSKAGSFWNTRCEFKHCVFGMCFFGQVLGDASSSFVFRNNVVTSAIKQKMWNFGWMVWAIGGAKAVQSDYNAFWYQPYDEKRWVAVLGGNDTFVPSKDADCYAGADGLKRWRAATSNDTHSLNIDNPKFQTYQGAVGWTNAVAMENCESSEAPKKVTWLDDFRLDPASPLKGKGEGGTDIGIRFYQETGKK